ncbi:MAG: hypothetical protein JWO58_2212 [Chitinophagaceae bacterium]|nr:hypothetical protein [Chitinophagaceae bacterium]
MERLWFQHKECTSLEIKKFRSLANHEVEKNITIEDQDIVQLFMSRIEQIPAGGEMMKSFIGTAEHIQLIFHGEQGTQTIDIIRKRFKTPSTGFNTHKIEIETSLYEDIDALLFPDFNKIILKVEQLEFIFPQFSITYKGHTFYDAAPATVQVSTDFFILKSDNIIQPLEIPSGQLPPQNLSTTINDIKLKLITHRTIDGKRLYPHYFQVEAL